jgi:hypothetical protein
VFEAINKFSLQQHGPFFSTIENKLDLIIQSSSDLKNIFDTPLSGDEYKLIFKKYFCKIIKNGEDFNSLFQTLSNEQRNFMFNEFKGEFNTIIKDGSDFASVLEFLTEEQRNCVYNELEEEFDALIKDGSDFASVLEFLTEEQRNCVYNKFKEKFNTLIKNGSDFASVLEFLTEEQRNCVYNEFKGKLNPLIKGGLDFIFVLQFLSEEQRKTVFDENIGKLKNKKHPSVIKKLQLYLPEYRNKIFNKIPPEFFNFIINDGKDFKEIMKLFSGELRAKFYNQFKEQFNTIIKNEKDFISVLEFLSEEECDEVIKEFKGKFTTIITTRKGFEDVLDTYLKEEQHKMICDETFFHIIKNGESFRDLLEALSEGKRSLVFNQIQEGLCDAICNNKINWNWNEVSQVLSKEQNDIISNKIKGKISVTSYENEETGFVTDNKVKENRAIVEIPKTDDKVYQVLSKKQNDIVSNKTEGKISVTCYEEETGSVDNKAKEDQATAEIQKIDGSINLVTTATLNQQINEQILANVENLKNDNNDLEKIKKSAIEAINNVWRAYQNSEKYLKLKNEISQKQTDDFFEDVKTIVLNQTYDNVINPDFEKNLKEKFSEKAENHQLIYHNNNIGARLVLDIMAAILSAGIFTFIAGITRKILGKSFFFSTVKTDREIKVVSEVIKNINSTMNANKKTL